MASWALVSDALSPSALHLHRHSRAIVSNWTLSVMLGILVIKSQAALLMKERKERGNLLRVTLGGRLFVWQMMRIMSCEQPFSTL